jgi:signal transduction histidine kinase
MIHPTTMLAISKKTGWPSVNYSWEDEPPSDQTELQLDCHSLLNILNIIAVLVEMRLMNLQPESRNDAVLEHVHEISDLIKAPEGSIEEALKESLELIRELDGFVATKIEFGGDVEESNKLIGEIASVLKTRVDELLERNLNPDDWVEVTAENVEQQLRDFFHAVQSNARGRYGIVYDRSDHSKTDYLVEMDFKLEHQAAFTIPPVLLDSFRDLAANARKYTDPGGTIRLELEQNHSFIRISVADNGKGIPSTEIDRVVEYGYRATNTGEVKTFGGGFGLTKALSVATRYKGAMLIESKEGEGTAIEIKIPSEKPV